MGQQDVHNRVFAHIRTRRLRRRWQKGVVALAVLVTALTASLLILPAVTMENRAQLRNCQLDLHTHTDSCRDANGEIICGYADYVVHTHDALCYDEQGALVCPLPQIAAHAHSAACYREVSVRACGLEESQGHTHTEACYETPQEATLVCPLPQTPGHTHGDACYRQVAQLTCGLEASADHAHSEACYTYQNELVCTLEEAPGHTHEAACYQAEPVLTCNLEESEGHTHTQACNEVRTECICGQEEIVLHTHDAHCVDASGALVCGKVEVREHVHDQRCLPAQDEPIQPASQPQDGRSWATVSKANFAQRSARLAAPNAESGRTDFGPYITAVTVFRQVDGQWAPATELTSGDSVKVEIRYAIPENVVGADARIIYYQLPAGIGLQEEASGPTTIGAQTVGSYVIHTSGLIEITFDPAFADDSPFTGELGFQGTVTATGGAGEEEIVFGGTGGSVTVVPGEAHYDLAIAKAGDYQREGNKLVYTLVVSTQDGTDGPVAVQDAFLHATDYGLVQYDEGSLRIVKVDAGGAETEVTGVAPTFRPQGSDAAASFAITGLPALRAGESYRIAYTATPDLASSAGSGDGYLAFSNQAVATDASNRAQAQANVMVSQSMVAKQGTYDELTRKVKWTILLNEDAREIGGFTLQDTLTYTDAQGQTHALALPATVTLTRLAGWDPAEQHTVSLPYTFAAGTNARYLVTYETDLPPQVQTGEGIVLHNRVRFGDYETQADVSVTVPAPLDYDVQKAFWGEAEDGQLSWASWITYPADARPTPASLVYVDRIVELMRPDGTYVENSHDTTLSLLYNSLYVTTPDGTPLAYGTDFWVYAVSTADTPPPEQLAAANFEQILTGLAWKDIWEMEADEPLTLFGIAFSEGAMDKIAGQSIVVGYRTQIHSDAMAGEEVLQAGNYARIPNHEAYAYTAYAPSTKLNKQASAQGVIEGSQDTHSFTDDPLTLQDDGTGGVIHYRLLLRELQSEPDAVVVTDTLPQGATLLADSVKLRLHAQENGDENFEDVAGQAYYLAVATQAESDGTTKVTFTITHHHELPDDATVGIYYDVSVADDPAWAQEDTRVYTNRAQWGDATDSTTTTVEKVTPYLSKWGEQLMQPDESGQPVYTDTVRYYIAVNPQGEDLNPYAQTLTLTDTMQTPAGSGAAFLPQSVAVYHYQADAAENHYCGERIDAAQYTVHYDRERHTLTFTLPDSTPCVVVYDYAIDRGTAAGDLQLSNRVALSGRGEISSESGIVIQEQSSSATVNRATMTVYKHDRANIAKLLPGARFQLERYEPGGEGSYAWQTTSVTAQGEDGAFVVGESGMIVLNFLSEEQDGGSRYNLLYRIRETAPPAGYLQSDAVYYFVWMEQGASREQTVERMRQSGALGDVSPDAVQFIPFSTAGTLYVPNEPDQLTVTKQWQQHSGMPLQHPPSQSVKVTLYQWRADGSRTVYQTVELHGQNNWSHTWTALPKADADGAAYRYTVEEEHVPGFTPTYSANNDSGVQTGEIVITNTEQDGYVLPETGGVGTPLYTAAGLLLIAAFCAGYMGRRYGRP